MYAGYYDKYGAPVNKHESWTDGYRDVEKQLALVSTIQRLHSTGYNTATIIFQCITCYAHCTGEYRESVEGASHMVSVIGISGRTVYLLISIKQLFFINGTIQYVVKQ